MSTYSYEPDADLSLGGLVMANDPESGALLVNAEKADEFDERVSQEVEGLLYLGRLTHECELYGHTITLRTLTRGERLAASLFVREYEDTLGLADALQTAYLALAITTVDGRPLTISLGKEPVEARLRRNFEIVRNWYDPIVEALYTEYSHLLVRMKNALDEFEGKLIAGRATSAS